MATADWEEDEWELINDDGFVYKRKKRPRLDPSSSSAAAAPPPPDPAAEEKNRRERKKRVLTKLRDKYEKEIGRWELLSNTWKALQERPQTQQQQQEQWHEKETTGIDLAGDLPQPSESSDRRLLHDLLLRVEAEDAIIQDVSNLCDMAEAICNLQEESTNQSLFDLPVWGSPRELLASLCDE